MAVTLHAHSTLIAATARDDGAALAAEDIARACDAQIEWVLQLVRTGIVQALGAPEQSLSSLASLGPWRFGSADLRRALEVRRLERDFDASLDAAALILDLETEVRRLRALLRARGLRD